MNRILIEQLFHAPLVLFLELVVFLLVSKQIYGVSMGQLKRSKLKHGEASRFLKVAVETGTIWDLFGHLSEVMSAHSTAKSSAASEAHCPPSAIVQRNCSSLKTSQDSI